MSDLHPVSEPPVEGKVTVQGEGTASVAFRVECEHGGCEMCGHDARWTVVGPGDVAESVPFSHQDEAQELADAMNRAYESGRCAAEQDVTVAAWRIAVQDVCTYCSGRELGWSNAQGPNAAGNYIHYSTGDGTRLCPASAVHARLQGQRRS